MSDLEKRVAALENKVEALSHQLLDVFPLITKTIDNSSKVLAGWESSDKQVSCKEEDK
jgi:hypothetical protein